MSTCSTDVHFVLQLQRTCLHIASLNGHTEVVDYLLHLPGVSIDARSHVSDYWKLLRVLSLQCNSLHSEIGETENIIVTFQTAYTLMLR